MSLRLGFYRDCNLLFYTEIIGLGLHLRTIQCGLLALKDSRELNTFCFTVTRPFDHPNCLSPSLSRQSCFTSQCSFQETIIALLTLFKGVQYLRSSHPFPTELYVSGMSFYACILFMTLANILLPMWVPGIALFLGQSILHCILSNRVLLFILKQRRIRRRYPTEEVVHG